MDGIPLTLDLFKELDPLLRSSNISLSEYNFPNLFLFREKHTYSWIKKKGVIRGIAYDKKPFFLPLQMPPGKDLLEGSEMLFPIQEEELSYFPEKRFTRIENRDDDDYLFKRESMALLPGRNRSGRRNLIYQFERNFPNAEVVSLEVERVPLALKLLDEWGEGRGEGDKKNCMEALEFMDPLGMEGIMVLDGNLPLAFSIFSPLNDETLLVHFAKSLPRYKGAQAFLFERLAKATSYPWLNLAQDLGLPGLRQEKLSYGPDILKKKWRIIKRDKHAL